MLSCSVWFSEFLDGWWSWEPLPRLCVRCGWCMAPSALYTRPTQQLSRPPPIQKLGKPYAANQHIIIIIIIILLLLLTAIGLSPGGSGYFTCIQNMKLVTTKFKSGGLHEKHVVATWNFGNRLSICF